MANNDKREKGQANTTQRNKQIPYCLTCFDILFGELCEECGELIGCEVGAIIHEGRSWHASETCFRCSLCLKSLLGKPFLPAMDGRIYCSIICSQAMVSHQKERLRRQNKLQTLQIRKHVGMEMNGTNTRQNTSRILENDLKPNITQIIKENRNDFLKSMTLGRYDQMKKMRPSLPQQHESFHLQTKENSTIKSLNLAQISNYEQFIKQNNRCFTSKYDWSKEQEFMDVINCSHRKVSSSVNSSDRSSESSCGSKNNMVQQFIIKCAISTNQVHNSLPDNRLDLSSNLQIETEANNHSNGCQDEFHEMTRKTLIENSFQRPNTTYSPNYSEQSVESSSLVQSPQSISSQTSDCKQGFVHASSTKVLSPHSNETFYSDDKTRLLISPASSNETNPSWAVSPPPEYSKLESDINRDGENSSISSNQNIEYLKRNGILKCNRHTQLSVHSLQPEASDIPLIASPQRTLAANTHSVMPNAQECPKPILKSVSFDPNVEDKNENNRRSIRKIAFKEVDHNDCDSCSSCSTCSSSSSDYEDDELDLTNFKSSLQTEQSKPNQTTANNESCTISWFKKLHRNVKNKHLIRVKVTLPLILYFLHVYN